MAEEDPIARYERETPEHKIELIDGQLTIGNGLPGSRYLLHDLLSDWGVEAVLPWAGEEDWRAALAQGFASERPPEPTADLPAWREWAEQVAFEPALEPAGPMQTGEHYAVREAVKWGLAGACGAGRFGASFGHDFVMHLGDHACTPDTFLVGRQGASERMFERYLNGPADLVVEVLLAGHERQDREVKRQIYEAGGVREYWLIDPVRRSVEFLHLASGRYEPRSPAGGHYRPVGFPGLVLVIERLWKRPVDWYRNSVFEVEARLPAGWSWQAQRGIAWDDVPFAPQLALEPGRIAFEEFASWCPRAKFENYGEGLVIGSRTGTRNVLAMLVRTLGLVGTVKLLPPRVWVAGLLKADQERREDARRKQAWWELARQAAALLRAEQDIQHITVVGDLLRPEPLTFWSRLSLVIRCAERWDYVELYRCLRDLEGARVIELLDPERLSREEKEAVERGGVELD